MSHNKQHGVTVDSITICFILRNPNPLNSTLVWDILIVKLNTQHQEDLPWDVIIAVIVVAAGAVFVVVVAATVSHAIVTVVANGGDDDAGFNQHSSCSNLSSKKY